MQISFAFLNPQRWNKYAYVVNNPLAFTDPNGRDAIAVGFKTLALGAGHAAGIRLAFSSHAKPDLCRRDSHSLRSKIGCIRA